MLENEDDEGSTNGALSIAELVASVDVVTAASSLLDEESPEVVPAAVTDSSDDSVGSTNEVLPDDVVASLVVSSLAVSGVDWVVGASACEALEVVGDECADKISLFLFEVASAVKPGDDVTRLIVVGS